MKRIVILLLFCAAGRAALGATLQSSGPIEHAAPQDQKPSIATQSGIVPPKDALKGADWLRAEGVSQGLDQLDLGADSKGKPIRFEMIGSGGGIQIRLSGSGLDAALADKAGGGLLGKFKKKDESARGASGLTVTDLFGPHFAPSDLESKGSAAAESANRNLGKLSKLNKLMGGGTEHYLAGSNLYASDLRTIEQNAPVIKLLAEGKADEANKLYSSLHASDADADLGTSDPAKLALIQNANATMDNITAQEQARAKTLHFKAEGGEIVAHLDDRQTGNLEKVLQSMSAYQLFQTAQLTHKKDSGGKGFITVDSTISSQDFARAAACLKLAIDDGDAKTVKAYQKYKGINDMNLPKRPSN